MEKKRITYLDMVKGIGIILVVFGHSTYAPDGAITWLASFHMPLFFMVSGMVIWQIKEEEKSFLQSLQRKAKSIMIPYVTFSILFIIVKLLYLVRMPELITIDQIWEAVYQTITFYGISVMWFLPTLFVSEMLFLGVRKIKLWKDVVTIVAAILLGILAVSAKPIIDQITVIGVYYVSCMLLRSFAAFVFIVIGYYMKKIVIKDREKKSIVEILLGIGLCVMVVYLSMVNQRVDMNFLVFGNPLLFYCTAVLGTMGLIYLCKNMGTCKSLVYLGVNSLIIMATHLECQVLMLAITFAKIISNLIPITNNFIYYFCFVALLIMMEVVIIYVFNHYLYFLIGKKKIK